MSTSTLDPENIPEPDRILGKGHGTGALGPSDSSDSGSDVAGSIAEPEFDMTGPDGVPIEADQHRLELDSDTDSSGTGERASVEQDAGIRDGQDIGVDRIDRMVPELPGDEPVEGYPEQLEPDKRVTKAP